MFKKMLMAGLLGIGLSTFQAPAHAADCGEVTMTEMNWASSLLVTQVSKFLMEQGYGCKVNTVPTSNIPALTSISETGKPDIATELWVNTLPVYPEMESEGKLVTAAQVLSDGGQEGFWIPLYLANRYPELKTIEGILKNPDLVGGRFHNCPEGWSCKNVNDGLAQLFDFEAAGIDNFIHGSGETLGTSIASAYGDQAPWFGYYWAPTAILGKYPMVKVDIGPVDPVAYGCLSDPDCPPTTPSDYPVSEVLTAVTTDFGARNPEILTLMTNVTFTNYQMNEVLAWQETNNASAEEAAVYFLNKYKDVWSAWIDDAARAKLDAILGG